MILYGIKLSLEKRIAFDRDDFVKTVKIDSSEYMVGFLVACTSFDIVRFNMKGKVITATYLDPLIVQTIQTEIEEMAKPNEIWQNWVTLINEYFELPFLSIASPPASVYH